MADANGVILAADEAVCDFLGRSSRDLMGISYAEFTHPADRLRNAMQIDRLRACERPTTIQKRYVRPDGDVIWADVAISRLESGSDAGRLLGTLSIGTATGVQPTRLWRTAVELARFDDIRRDLLGGDLFGDRVWAILIQMYLAEAEGRSIDASNLAVATGLPAAAVTRWLAVLEARDLVEPRLDDGGRQLTVQGIARLEKVMIAYRAGRQPDMSNKRLPEA